MGFWLHDYAINGIFHTGPFHTDVVLFFTGSASGFSPLVVRLLVITVHNNEI